MKTFMIDVMCGLPASGKTTHVKEQMIKDEKSKYEFHPIWKTIALNLDGHDDSDLETIVRKEFYSKKNKIFQKIHPYDDVTIRIMVDGLILNFDDFKKVVDTCTLFINENEPIYGYTITPTAHIWNEDRDTCINNDRIRVMIGERETHSETTIRHLEYKLDKDQFKKEGYKVVEHEVYKATTYDITIKKFGNDDDKLESDYWSLGGNYGTCWDDQLHTIHPSSQPTSFQEFDNMLGEICPNITFLQYKKVYNESVSISEWTERDYYGGAENFARYVCDLRKLYECLVEFGLISDELK